MSTPSAVHQVDHRPRRFARWTPSELLAVTVERAIGDKTDDRFVWPSATYAADPVRFFEEVLKVQLWARQLEIVRALLEHDRVAVASGHKVGKSILAAGLALWFFCSFDDARVLMTAPTERQVNKVLWRELRKLHKAALVTIDGRPGKNAKSGLTSPDFREVYGFTATEAEAVAGTSGASMLYIIDEASGVESQVFEGIEGNRAAGKIKVLMLSNPTRTEGDFFEAFDTKAEFWKTFQISSEESPNVVQGREVVRGLCGREWIEEKRKEWGEDSPLYKVRVKGEFVLGESGKVISIALIGEAEERWDTAEEDGRLQFGIDPAGSGEGADETAIAVRRGRKLLGVHAFRSQGPADQLRRLLELVKAHREDSEVPLVCFDAEGEHGAKLYGVLRAHVEIHDRSLECVPVYASKPAVRQPQTYDRIRDELWANMRDWLVSDGAIPEDVKLAKELHAPSLEQNLAGKTKVTAKSELRKMLGRSPDRADAVALSVWEPAHIRDGGDSPAEKSDESEFDQTVEFIETAFDPYAGMKPWGGG